MTLAELIEELKKFPPDAVVITDVYFCCVDDSSKISEDLMCRTSPCDGSTTVWLRSK